MSRDQPVTPRDTLNRPLRELRLSVTDRCNFRCTYCMPLDHYDWIPRKQILRFEEMVRLATLFATLGVNGLRLTGGEPLLRRHLPVLVEMLSAVPGIDEIGLTTNATRLTQLAQPLRDAGLGRINVSLDTLNAARFRELTKRDGLNEVIGGIDAALAAGLTPVKLNCVLQRGVNDDEIVAMVEFARQRGCELRFIEFMDVGTANGWRMEQVVGRAEIVEILKQHFDLQSLGRKHPSDPAERWLVAGSETRIGVIPSVTAPFCAGCNRARLTANGQLVTCLFADAGHDLKTPLRDGASDEQMLELISGIWTARTDRYSEIRTDETHRARLKNRKKLEMITLGG